MQRQTESMAQPGRWSIAAAVVVWTLLIGGGLFQILQEDREHAVELARAEARSALGRALQFRRWVGSHGGIYVPAGNTAERRSGSQPVEREGQTPPGKTLSLIDSWDLLQELGEAADASELPRLKLTIWRPRPVEDKSQAWEIEALRACEQGAPEVGEIVLLGDVPHVRLLHPLFVEPGCGASDGGEDRREGDLCGGISVAIPLQPYGMVSALQMRRHLLTYTCVWLVGLLGVAYGARQIRTRFEERLQAEERLQKWEALLAVAVEQSPSGILIADAPDVKIQYANQAALAIRGHSEQPLDGISVERHSPVWQTFLPDGVTPYPSEQLPLSRAVLEGVVSDHVEAVIRRSDGEERWVTANAGPVRNKSGEIVAGIVVFHDVTERKRAEEAVRLDEARWEAILQLSQMAEASLADIVEFAMEEAVRLTQSRIGYVAFASEDESVLTMYAWSEEAMRQCDVEELPRVYPVAATGLWGEAVRQRRPIITNDYAASNPWKRGMPAGHVPLSRHMNAPIFDGGRIVIVAGVGNKQTDYDESDLRQLTLLMTGLWRIVERKKADAALRESQQRFQQYLDVAGVILVALDLEGRVTLINRKGCEVLGYTEAELLGRTWFDICLPAAVRADVARLFQEMTSDTTGFAEYYENPVLAKTGEERIVAWHNKLIRNDRQQITGILSSGEDITERKHAEEALRRSELLNRRLVEHLPQSVFVKDRNSSFTFCNANFSRPLGLTPEQMVGLDDFAFYPQELAEKYRLDDRRVMETGTMTDIEEVNRLGDAERWVHVVKVPYHAERGEVIGVMGIFEDITERKQAEDEVRRLNLTLEERVRERTARWETANKDLEAFTYSVSHDLRAPLRAINGYARMLTEGYGRHLDAEGLRILGVVCSEAERMGRLIDELLNFSRLGRSGLRPVPIDMTALVREVCTQCGPSFAHRQVDLELAPLPAAVADLSLLRQVWTNLIDNALKFTRHRERARIEIGGWTRDGEHVYFVKDNGAGFDMKYADKLFRFFQRLHGLNEFEGHGVGLALVQRIIRLHNGRVWAEAEVDRGAFFRFALPQINEGGP